MENENITNVTSSQCNFDNLTILKEFSNITNAISNEDFLDIVPKAKMGRVYWITVLNCLKQRILDEMVEEMNSMWSFENMNIKLDVLEKQKEKFSDIPSDTQLWRPQHNNIKDQLRASDAAILRKQKALLEPISKEYNTKVSKLKKTVLAKRQYIKALQMDIQKYQKKNEEIISQISEKIQSHAKLSQDIVPKFDNSIWSKKDDFHG
ncbi:unnamed protein product [Leptosia nina]|uniref:Uncharacterized protein n=1 Tax=Leptosia nina TaxID=320188 RepID=A0AAV1J4H3_9NEOP